MNFYYMRIPQQDGITPSDAIRQNPLVQICFIRLRRNACGRCLWRNLRLSHRLKKQFLPRNDTPITPKASLGDESVRTEEISGFNFHFIFQKIIIRTWFLLPVRLESSGRANQFLTFWLGEPVPGNREVPRLAGGRWFL